MSEYVIVRINEKLIPEFQINFNATEDRATKSKISLWSDIKIQTNQKLILLLSGNIILNTSIKIPSKNDEVIRQSIPFALEEELANDIDDNHFAYQQHADQICDVSIVTKKIISELSTIIHDNGLYCQQLYSELAIVPFHEQATTFCILADYVLISEGHSGTCIDQQQVSKYLKLSDHHKQVVYADKLLKLADNAAIQFNKVDTTLLFAKTLFKHIETNKAINLFQGEFSQSIDHKKAKNSWRKPIILSLLLLLSWLLINLSQIWKLNSRIDSLKQDQSALLLKLIPNASQVEQNDPYSAILSRLKISQNQVSSDSVGFVNALSYLGQTLQQHPTIQVQSLRLRNNKVEIKLIAENVTLLNQFQASLAQNALTMRISTGTRNTDKDGISSVISMEQL